MLFWDKYDAVIVAASGQGAGPGAGARGERGQVCPSSPFMAVKDAGGDRYKHRPNVTTRHGEVHSAYTAIEFKPSGSKERSQPLSRLSSFSLLTSMRFKLERNKKN
ncbi:hypothetical protein EVAR_103403_1 [Eumeta japonica]|uniref:Uncharacterized protein n=1 Tax=Eumeta variegata TaxID=151549 RepID=A0A4C1YV86_EUMVA|nr:hypothetical protein EVAR_103403_1 [Eumeta japonica]